MWKRFLAMKLKKQRKLLLSAREWASCTGARCGLPKMTKFDQNLTKLTKIAEIWRKFDQNWPVHGDHVGANFTLFNFIAPLCRGPFPLFLARPILWASQSMVALRTNLGLATMRRKAGRSRNRDEEGEELCGWKLRTPSWTRAGISTELPIPLVHDGVRNIPPHTPLSSLFISISRTLSV